MPQYRLPKWLHPDFAIPGRKPTGKVKLDQNNYFASKMLFFGVVVPGGVYDVVSEVFYPLPSATFISSRDGELIANYTSGQVDLLTPVKTIPWQATPGVDGQRSAGVRVTRTAKGANGDTANFVKFYSVAGGSGDERLDFASVAEYSIDSANITYDIGSSGQYSWNSYFNTDTTDPMVQGYLLNFSESTESGQSGNNWHARSFTEGAFVNDSSGSAGGMPHSELAQIRVGHDSSGTAEVAISCFWFAEGFFTDAEQAALNRDLWQVLEPAVPILYFTPGGAAGPQTINITAITELETLGSLTVDPGGISASITAITEVETLGSLAVGIGAATINIGSITETESLASVAVDAGAVSVTIGAITELEALAGPTPEQGAVISISAITELESLGSVTVDAGAVSVAIGSITEIEALGSLAVIQGTSVDIGSIIEHETLSGPTADVGAVSVAISAIVEHETLSPLSVIQVGDATSITVSGITGGESLVGLSYCVFSAANIGDPGTTIIAQGTTETTDANGDLVIDLTGLGVSVGTVLTIIITNYTTAPALTDRGAVCFGVAA